MSVPQISIYRPRTATGYWIENCDSEWSVCALLITHPVHRLG